MSPTATVERRCAAVPLEALLGPDRELVDRYAKRAGRLGTGADAQRRCVGVEQRHRAGQIREVVLDRARDRRQRLVERHAARDLLQDLGLMAREHRGPAAIGDVAPDGLEADDVALVVEECAVGPLVPVHGAALGVLPVLLHLDFVAGPERLQACFLALAFGRCEHVDQPGAEQFRRRAPEEFREGAVHERQRRVREVPTHELGLVVDHGAVVRFSLAEAPFARAQRVLGQLAFGDVADRDDDAHDRGVVEQVVRKDLRVHPRPVGALQPHFERTQHAPHVSYAFEEVLDDRLVVGMDEVDDVLAVTRAFGIAEHVGRHRAGVAQLAVGIDQRDHVRRAGDQRLQPFLDSRGSPRPHRRDR